MRVLALVLLAGLVAATPATGAPGDLDGGFGVGGRTAVAVGSGNASLFGGVRQADGTLVGVGQAQVAGAGFDVLVARFTPSGTLDPTFNPAGPQPGVLTFPISSGTANEGANAVALGPSGTVYVAGATDPPAAGDLGDLFIARVTAGGLVDTGFSTDGYETLSLGSGDFADEIAVQGDGKVVVAGYGDTAADGMLVARVDGTTGAPDASFGAGGPATGVQEVDFSASGIDVARGLVLTGGGIVVAGTAGQASGSDDLALAQLTSAGVLDTAGFGGGTGKVRTAGGSRELAADLAVDAQGRLVVAGAVQGPPGLDVLVSRYTQSGQTDGAFSDDGTTNVTIAGSDGTRFAQATSVGVDAQGRIVAAGSMFACGAAGCADSAVARLLENGDPDPAFGSAGRAVHDLSGAGRNDSANAVALGSLFLFGTAFDGAVERALAASISEVGARRPQTAAKPTIVGTPVVGQPTVCNAQVWENGPTRFDFAWTIDGVLVASTTSTTGTSSFTPSAADAGKTIVCRVTASNDAGATEGPASDPVPVSPAAPPAAAPCPGAYETALAGLAARKVARLRDEIRGQRVKKAQAERVLEEIKDAKTAHVVAGGAAAAAAGALLFFPEPTFLTKVAAAGVGLFSAIEGAQAAYWELQERQSDRYIKAIDTWIEIEEAEISALDRLAKRVCEPFARAELERRLGAGTRPRSTRSAALGATLPAAFAARAAPRATRRTPRFRLRVGGRLSLRARRVVATVNRGLGSQSRMLTQVEASTAALGRVTAALGRRDLAGIEAAERAAASAAAAEAIAIRRAAKDRRALATTLIGASDVPAPRLQALARRFARRSLTRITAIMRESGLSPASIQRARRLLSRGLSGAAGRGLVAVTTSAARADTEAATALAGFATNLRK